MHTVGSSNLFEKKRQWATGGGWIEFFFKKEVVFLVIHLSMFSYSPLPFNIDGLTRWTKMCQVTTIWPSRGITSILYRARLAVYSIKNVIFFHESKPLMFKSHGTLNSHSLNSTAASSDTVPAGKPRPPLLGNMSCHYRWQIRTVYSLPIDISLFPTRDLRNTYPDALGHILITTEATMFAWFNAKGQ